MDLTRRQLELLVQLANTNLWLNSEKLAEQVNTNKKTVQLEIKNMIENYQNDIIIESNKRKGYHLVYLSPELQSKIILDAKKHKIYSSMNFRASTIIIYIIFQENYVSMQHLADIFFLSKTAISNEIKTIQRWVNRNDNLELEISNQKGLKIHATEDMKRIFASMVGTEAVLLESRLPNDFIDEVTQLGQPIQNMLKKILMDSNYIISGEDFLRYARYIALTISRRKFSCELEETPLNNMIVPVINKIVTSIETEFDYEVSSAEKVSLEKRLLELNYLFLDDREKFALEKNLNEFEKSIIDFLNLPESKLFKHSDTLVMHIQQMELRMIAGHNVLNHHAKKTLVNYPLETYLVRKFFPIHFNLRPNLAEISYLVLYVAESLDKYKGIGTLLVVSNQSFSVLNTLKCGLEDVLRHRIKDIQVEPVYVFEARKDFDRRISFALTTEQEIIFNYPHFKFIPSVLNENELDNLCSTLYQSIQKKKEVHKKEFLNRYYTSKSKVLVRKKINNLQLLIPDIKNAIIVPITSKLLFVCEINETGPTKIQEYHLEQPIIYQQKKIYTILHISYKKDPLIFLDFSAVSDLLKNL